MTKERKIIINYLLYFLSMLLVCIVGISNVFADTFNPSSALQYYEYYSSGTKQETSIQYGNNIMLGSPNAINYPYAMSLILYGNYLQDKTYTLNVNIDTYFESNYFKFYYENLNYLIVSAQIVTGSERTLCNLQPITQNQSYSVGCTFKPTTNLSQVILSLVNYDYQNNGYVPFGSGDYVKFTNYNMAVYDNSSNIIIDQNNTIINQNNQNTQSIINNNNTNTENIINNQNQNTQEQIESQMICNYINNSYIENDNKYLRSDGTLGDNGNYGVSEYISIISSDIKVLDNQSNVFGYYCFYNANKSRISCSDNNSLQIGQKIIVPSGANYIRLSIRKQDIIPKFQICKNGNQALDDSIKEQTKTSKGILGKIGDLISYINPLSENFFVYKMVELFLDMLKSLFIPEDMSFINDFMDTLSNKLGFIASVPLRIIQFILDLPSVAFT